MYIRLSSLARSQRIARIVYGSQSTFTICGNRVYEKNPSISVTTLLVFSRNISM
jgi:hypothetical protein